MTFTSKFYSQINHNIIFENNWLIGSFFIYKDTIPKLRMTEANDVPISSRKNHIKICQTTTRFYFKKKFKLIKNRFFLEKKVINSHDFEVPSNSSTRKT